MSIAKAIGTAIVEVIMTFDDMDYRFWGWALGKLCPILREEDFDKAIEVANTWKGFRSGITDSLKFRVTQLFGLDVIELFLSTHEDEEISNLLDHL